MKYKETTNIIVFKTPLHFNITVAEKINKMTTTNIIDIFTF